MKTLKFTRFQTAGETLDGYPGQAGTEVIVGLDGGELFVQVTTRKIVWTRDRFAVAYQTMLTAWGTPEPATVATALAAIREAGATRKK